MNPSALAGTIYVTAVLTVFGVLLAVVMATVWLRLAGQPTVTDFLRQYPLWFALPGLVMLAILSWLTWHLFA